jgi:hypothetical protein
MVAVSRLVSAYFAGGWSRALGFLSASYNVEGYVKVVITYTVSFSFYPGECKLEAMLLLLPPPKPELR